jgi:hypothetical protein
MKKLIWMMLVLGPIVCRAQSDGKGAPLDGAKAVESIKAPSSPYPVGIYDSTLAQFRDRLALTPPQQPLWSDYENKVDAYTRAYYRQKPVVPTSEDTAPHQIGRQVNNLQNRLAALEDVESAAKMLYASLLPEQQNIANQMLILSIPTFTSSGIGSTLPPADALRKDNKPDAGKRSHRGGAS